MYRSTWHRTRSALVWMLLAASAAFAIGALAADTAVEYRYDDAGRLRGVVTPTTEGTYTLDAAGNRTTVTSATGRGMPSSLQVPANSTGDYTISWGAATPAPHHYELFEATNPAFTGETLYSSTTLSQSFTAKPYNTYYYRIRSCDTVSCGPRRTGANPIVVAPPPPPSVPGTMTIPATDIDGAYTVSWVASTGTVTAYQLYEATQSNFSNEVQVYSNTTASANLTGRGNGTFYYRVRGCNGPSCSGYSVGGNSTVVTLTPATPGVAVVPATYTNVGSYTVSWAASGGVVPVTRYELLENVAFGSESLIYNAATPSFAVSSRGNGTYSYRLRACNGGCSAYTATQGNGTVVMVDTVAPAPPASLTRTGQTFLNWSGGSTDSGGSGAGSGVDRWRVYRNGTLIATVLSPTVSYNDTAAPSNQTHTWTVRSVDRANNESTTAATLAAFVDTLPPSAPTGVSAVGVSPNSISISWTAATDPNGGTVSGYFVYRNGANQQLASGSPFVDAGLIPSTTYTYTVSAYDSVGNVGPLSAPANGTTQAQPTAPTPPGNLRKSPTTGTGASYTILWDAPTGGGTVSYYILEESANGGAFVPFPQINAPTTSKAFSGKSCGEYTYQAKACTAGGLCSSYSNSVLKRVCTN